MAVLILFFLIVDYLKFFSEEVDEIKQYWIFNGLCVRATKRVIETLTRREDILAIILHSIGIKMPSFELIDDTLLHTRNGIFKK